MRKEARNRVLIILSLIATAALFAGCAGSGGGGGGAGSGEPGAVRMKVAMKLPPQAAQRAASADTNPYDTALVAVFEYDENGYWYDEDYTNPYIYAATLTNLRLEPSTGDYVGQYTIILVPPGENYICQAFVFDTDMDPDDLSSQITTATPTALVAAIVDTVRSGVTSEVDVDSLTTVVAATTLYYAQQQTTPVALDNTSVISTSVKSDISDAVDALYASGTLTDANIMSNFTSPSYYVFYKDYWSYNTELIELFEAILTEAGLMGISAPSYVYDGTGTDIDAQTSTTELSANWAAVANATAYYYSAGTTSGASDTVSWTSTTATSKTVSSLTLTEGTKYYFSVKAKNGMGTYSSVTTSNGVTVVSAADTTAPQVSTFSPADGATGVPYDGTAFQIKFNESMNSTITLAGYSMTIENSTTGGTLIINSSNALSYGTFAWSTTTNTDDTLTFTLKWNATLLGSSLKVLKPNTTYNINPWTAPTNLQDLAGNVISTSGLSTSGSFTTGSLQASSFVPADGATGVAYDQTEFKVIFNACMDSTIDMDDPTTLSMSNFSVTLERRDTGGALTINPSNALSYGSFSWITTNMTADTLMFTLKDSATLTYDGLKTLKANKIYDITSRTVPTNLTDISGNPLNTSGIATTGSFTTAP
ncbi:MAG: Ig-like domain-containing protein [bacterium]